MDATAVAAAAGLSITPFRWRTGLRIAFHFGLFQALLPVLGWFGGRTIHDLISAVDHWIAFALLFAVGGRMIWESFHPARTGPEADPSRGLLLLVLSIAVSIDALAVGLSLAFLGIPIFLPAAVIGVVTALMTLTGFALGRRLGRTGGLRLKSAGGIILMVIGLRILLSHTLS